MARKQAQNQRVSETKEAVPVRSFETARGRARFGVPLLVFAVVGLAVSAYLAFEKLSGVVGPCLVGSGCDTVNSSQYSSVLGIPVALFGLAWSATAVVASLAWWRSGDRRPLYLLYAGGLVGLLFELYLVYLQLFVIRAVCSWCVVYGATVVVGWLVAVVAVTHREPAD